MTSKNNNFHPPSLKIGKVESRYPIIQGGMGVGISMAGLASAVARAGGIGVIAAVLIGITEKDFYADPQGATHRALSKQIKKAKEMAGGGPIGVNIMVALQDYEEMVGIAASAGADLIISGAGLPLKMPAMVPDGCDTALVPIVSSGRAAGLICRRWQEHYGRLPDAFVVEGPKAGGHLGFKAQDLEKPEFQVENLVREVIDSVHAYEKKYGVSIPVIAAGGIYTGHDIYRFIKMGAAGVQMGTRFVATHECDASDGFKQAYLKATKDDVLIIKSPVGMPGRALKGPFLDKMARGEKHPKKCAYKCIRTCRYPDTPYSISMALVNAQRGNLNAGFVFCGENVWRVDKIVAVEDLIQELVAGYREAASKDQVTSKTTA
ncbi:MAG: nitronate monooxygenase [Thermodesulfatator sp.]|nr:MAG: nitronate monooxygenase [Thermodesulfatator sp.]